MTRKRAVCPHVVHALADGHHTKCGLWFDPLLGDESGLSDHGKIIALSTPSTPATCHQCKIGRRSSWAESVSHG